MCLHCRLQCSIENPKLTFHKLALLYKQCNQFHIQRIISPASQVKREIKGKLNYTRNAENIQETFSQEAADVM